jgi:aspartate/methionine/tyrosine aminotransferase
MGGRAVIEPFHVMRVVEAVGIRRAAGRPVYDLSAGQPSTSAPAAVRAAAHAAIDGDRIGYTSALGLPALRTAIAEHCRRSYGLAVDGSDVVVTTGSSGAFLVAFLAAFKPGDLVVVTRPGYPAYRNMLVALGCRVMSLPGGARFQPSVAQLEALVERPAGVVLASPANPTGTMLTGPELAGIANWCDANGVRLVSDEIYHGITYGEPASSAWQTSRNAIVVNSFSKYFSMTGWRLGWLLAPAELLDLIDRLAGNFALCPPTLSQYASLGAFESYDELDSHVARYRVNRDLLITRLPQMGIERIAPVDGAFYVYADVSQWTDDSLKWCGRLLDQTGIAVAPGIDFDPIAGGGFIRMCFAGDTDTLGNAMDVLQEWLASSSTG